MPREILVDSVLAFRTEEDVDTFEGVKERRVVDTGFVSRLVML